MSEEEIEIVAEELAKVGGTTWYPGRETGPLIRVVSDRYRDRAKIAIEALERHRAKVAAEAARREAHSFASDQIRVGSTVVYRPPGERRAYTCRVEKIDGRQAYLVPDIKVSSGWVSLDDLTRPAGPRDVDGKH
ncbi:hypothetical protein [Microvirga pudoricolor]|uniref:hypothetical protein n=1 Tax=Microvirga pudoricolor TaxID=2778729 RepID=UPI00194FAAF0|nr:hypothetical protein [Microvirga pudoricolor]MBM6592619.1 hypothetical protein [Microvirga pudoricolor]